MALFYASIRCTQGLPAGETPDYAKSKEFQERLANRPGPPSEYVWMVRDNLAGHEKDDAARLVEQSSLYRAISSDLFPAEVSAGSAIVPGPDELWPDAYARRVDMYIFSQARVRALLGLNMVASGAAIQNSAQAVEWLRKRHAGDDYIQALLDDAATKIPQRFDRGSRLPLLDLPPIEK